MLQLNKQNSHQVIQVSYFLIIISYLQIIKILNFMSDTDPTKDEYKNIEAEKYITQIEQQKINRCYMHPDHFIQYYCLKCQKSSNQDQNDPLTTPVACQFCINQYHLHGRKRKIAKQHLLPLKQLEPQVKFKTYLIYLHEFNLLQIEQDHINCLKSEKQKKRIRQFKQLKNVQNEAIKVFQKYRKQLKNKEDCIIGMFQRTFKQKQQTIYTEIPLQLNHIAKESLIQLNFANNQIKQISQELNFEHLKKLDLNHNLLTSIKGISNFQKIQELFLQNNQLTEIDSIFQCQSLIVLKAYKNQITKIGDSINNLIYLVHLDLSNNCIEKICKQFRLPSLECLNISDNCIEKIADYIKLENLVKFKADFNRLKQIPNFGQVPKLQSIHLNNNNISIINSNSLFNSLKHLYIGNFAKKSQNTNNIVKIYNLQSIKTLKILQIQSNQLEYNQNPQSKLMKILERQNSFPEPIQKLIKIYFKRYSYQGVQQFLIDTYLQIKYQKAQQHSKNTSLQSDQWEFLKKNRYNNKLTSHIQHKQQFKISIQLTEQQIFKIMLQKITSNKIKTSHNRLASSDQRINNPTDYLKSIQQLRNYAVSINLNIQSMKFQDQTLYKTDMPYLLKLQKYNDIENILQLPSLELLILNNRPINIALFKASLMQNSVRSCLALNAQIPNLPIIRNIIRDTLVNQNIQTSIVALQLPYIKLKKFPKILTKFINLRKIDLRNNELQTLQNMSNFQLLINLNLQSNKIKSMRGLKNLINLTYINLKNNQIQKIEDLHTLNQLLEINLLGNRIKQFTLVGNQLDYNSKQSCFPIFCMPDLQILAIGNELSNILFPSYKQYEFQALYSLKYVIFEGDENVIKNQIVNQWEKLGADTLFIYDRVKILSNKTE